MRIRVFSIAWFWFFISTCKAALPLNGNWGEWTNCSESCGGGFIWRTCVSVNASDNIAPICNVGSSENRVCYLKECETPYKSDGFGPWSEWASYPEDNKQQYRTRDCLDESKGCEGYKIEIVAIQVITNYRRARYLSSGGQTNINYIPRRNFSSDGQYEEEDAFWIHYQYGDDTVSKIDSCEEVEDDWLQWSSWSSDSDGNETRTRKCKDETKLCRGYNKEKRVRMGPGYTGNPEEHPEDWGPWSEWEVLNERRTRKRDCLNKSGPCRGQSEETETTEIIKEVWEIEIVEGEAEEDSNDWFQWSGWTLEAQNKMSRTRVCKNLSKGGPCRGMKTQRKILVTYVVRNGYEYHADDYLVEDDTEAWGPWTEWTDGPREFMSRRRECLSKQGCRGKSVMVRRKAVVIPPVATTPTKEEITTSPAEDLEIGKLVKRPTPSQPTTTPELPPGPLVALTTIPIPVTPTDGNWGQWSDWLPPSGPKNTIMRKRLCDSPPPSNDGQDCIGDDFEIYNETIAVNGEWGIWSTWSEPLDNQNPTKIERTRQCDNPSPSNGGLECTGDSKEYQDYFIPVDGMWSPWSEWTPSESNVTQESRTRTCTNPAPLYQGKTCEGSDYEQRTVSIPVDGNWSKWGPWTEPAGTQPQETLTRTRFCDNPSPSNEGKECEGNDTETKVHNNPINGGWSPWEEWSQPLPGKTTVQRNRFCNNPAPDFGGSSCEGPDSQTKEVILPTNGSWSDWSSWSPLTKLSNPETISRTRECNNPAPENGGSYCSGEDKESKEVYHPVDGGWNEWSSWTEPDESDVSTRKRTCNNPEPQYDGSPCFGVEVETKTVLRAVDGQWGNWEPWPVPTFETNPQVLTRKRNCDNPVPSNGGLPCEGDDSEAKNVTRPIDGNWGQWIEWTPVEGKDQKERKRICNKPEPMFGGKACEGMDTEVVDVLRVIDGGWTEWGQWSTQTFTTNPETITRKRFCENPKPANGGKQCEGPGVEEQEITRPIDGNWGPWSDWVQDSSTEDFLRYRECNNPEPMYDGAPCLGSDVDLIQKPKACPEGYMYIEEVKKCYKLIKRRLNWETSRGICQKFHPGLQLATIFNQNDQNALSKYLKSQNDSVQKKCFNAQTSDVLVWLGAKHTGGSPEGAFYWDVNDEDDPTDNPVDFEFWSDKNEATGFNVDEDRCVYLKHPDLKWTSGPCGCDEQGTPDEPLDSEDDDEKPDDGGKIDPQDPTNFLDYSVESLTLPDGTPESPEGWEEFGEWTPVNSKESERKRNCLKADNSCKGKTIQKRKRRIFRIVGDYTIDISKEDEENTKDFTQWGSWTSIYNTIMIKTRTCKSPTKRCSGSLKAIKMKKEYRVPGRTWWRQAWNGGWTSGLDFDDLRDYSIDISDVGVPEVPEDWNDWNFWLKDGPDNWVRNRSCINAPVGPCRGQYVQKKRVRRWKKVGSWSLDEDKDKEVPDDWNSWAEWTRIKPNILDMWRQYRLCKNPSGPCRGKAIRYKRKSLKNLTGSTNIFVDADDDDDDDGEEDSKDVKFEDPTSFSIDGLGSSYGDWDNWGPWKVTDAGELKRRRSCKKSNCTGASEQTKRRRKYVIEGSWEVTSTQDNGQESLEDWFSWSLWTKQANLELWSRLRTCKTGITGLCRGKVIQYRRKIKSKRVYLYGKYAWNWFKDWSGSRLLKWGALTGFGANFGLDLDSVGIGTGNLLDEGFGMGIGIGGLQLDMDLGVGPLNWPYGDWEYDLTGDLAVKEENPDNWDNWNPWEDKGDGWFARERKCRNDAPDGYCEGNLKQRRRIKIWTLTSQWLIEDIGDSTGDWLNFGDWQEDGVGLGFWFRTRKCKSNNCKGKIVQYRKLSERRWGFGWGWNVRKGIWYKGWGWNWLKKDAELEYSTAVTIPETSPSNWKWTWITGNLQFQIKLLHWWDWIRGNDWKLSKLFQGDVKGQKVRANWRHIRLARRRWSWSGYSARWSTYRHRGVRRGWTNIRKAGWNKLRLGHKKVIKTDDSSAKLSGKWRKWKQVKITKSGQFQEGSNSIFDSLLDSFRIKLPFIKSGFINQSFETKKSGFVHKKIGFSAFSSMINKFDATKQGSEDSEIGNLMNLGGKKIGSGWMGKIIKSKVQLGSELEDFGSDGKDFVASGSKGFGFMKGTFGGSKFSKFEKKVGGFSIQSKSVDAGWRQTGTFSSGNTNFGASGFGGFVGIGGKDSPNRNSGSSDGFKGGKFNGQFKSQKGRRQKRFAALSTNEESYVSVNSQNKDLLSGVTDWELWNESGPDFNPESAECSYNMCSLCELDVGNSQLSA